ncbi:MAG: glycerol kinase GlpK [Microbacteriaceae bacterium]|nr:glycerol kinase GlpK [Microbacteriaceae bacterium]
MSMKFVAAIDQGTTSTRCIVFDHDANLVSIANKEHAQHFPKPGWVEHDALEIWQNTVEVVTSAIQKAGVEAGEIAAIGITNQRETTVLWDRATGNPVAPVIVWQDTRTDQIVKRLESERGANWFRERTGLPPATYFSGPKLTWLLANDKSLKNRAKKGELAFGTIDSWLIWNLTGGVDGGRHITDVTNASRTMLMNLETLQWDSELLKVMDVPREILPEITSSSEIYGETIAELGGIPISGVLGDQQAALFGQTCFEAGELKSTYGTGAFLLLNTGIQPIHSTSGLVSTVAYKLAGEPARFALEGSIAVSGSLVQWFRDQLGLIKESSEIEALAESVSDNGGCYIVPAFSGLFAPHWRSDARGVIAGLTAFVTKAHLARAVLEASAWQTRELVEAMKQDAGLDFTELRVDGGMTANNLFLQQLADILDCRVVRPKILETTALGAAYAAGLAVGFWRDLEELKKNWREDRSVSPQLIALKRESEFRNWKKAVDRTLNWVE